MSHTKDVKTRIQVSPRIAELVDRFASMQPEEAQKQIAILPYYHQLENEITKPNQGVFTTRYFVTRWRPSLGSEAASIVLALRLLANNDGETFASQDTIAEYAGLSLRACQRWLSTSKPADRSEKWQAQWAVLHKYFLRSKTARYRMKRDAHRGSIVKRTTSLYKVAMDDPIHPDDEALLHVKAAERIVSHEELLEKNGLETNELSHNRPIGGHGKSITITEDDLPESVDNSSHNRPMGGHDTPPIGRSRSLSYRSNVINVKGTSNKQSLRNHPAVKAMSLDEKNKKEALAFEIGDLLSTMAGTGTGTDPHKSAGFHNRIAFLLPEQFVHEALTATRDAMDDQRAGRKTMRSGPAAYFAGIVRQIAEREKIDLGIDWKGKTVSGRN